jgi:hypothetical protein
MSLPSGPRTMDTAAEELVLKSVNAGKLIRGFSTEDGRWIAYTQPAFTPFVVLAGVAAAQGAKIEVDFVPQDSFEAEQSVAAGFRGAAMNNTQHALDSAANDTRSIFPRAEQIEAFAANFPRHGSHGKMISAYPMDIASRLDKINARVSKPDEALTVRSFLLLGAAAELNQRNLLVSLKSQ